MSHKHYSYISSSADHGMHGIFKQRFERPMHARFYISSSNNSSNSSSDSVHSRVNHGLSGGVEVGGGAINLGSLPGSVNIANASGSIALAANANNNLEAVRPSGSGINVGAAASIAADGNRSSASSEGFCENDDFGGDSSSNNLCSDGGHTLEPAAVAAQKKALTTRFEVSTPPDAEVEVRNSVEDLVAEQPENEFKIPLTPTNIMPNYQASTTTLSSESSSSASTPISSSAAVAMDAMRRLTKDDSFSSCASADEEAAARVIAAAAAVVNNAAVKALELDVMPSTSASAARAITYNKVDSNSITTAELGATNNVTSGNEELVIPAAAAAATTTATATIPPAATEKPHVFSNVRPTEDAWDILLARAEGLHAHGHGREACILAVRLAEEMLANPPNLMVELPPLPKRKGKNKNINPISHHLTVLASATLSKCAFLCTVLSENSKHYHIGFRICLFALEMPRPPASTKPLEVKLANQEADILSLLKKIPLNEPELHIIRDRAERLRNGTLKSRGEALLPINLATFIFDALVMPLLTVKEQRTRMSMLYRLPTDENLGFEAAVAALGLKANVSEAEHPLLCEGTRRQRGDLALTLLYYYKDEPRKIGKIMEKLLDREIHTLLKLPLLPAYYSSNPPVRTPNTAGRHNDHDYACNSAGMQQNASGLNEIMLSDYNSSVGGNSRPHSSTSAELEVNMSALNINSPQGAAQNGNGNGNAQSGITAVTTTTNTAQNNNVSRSKDCSRYKGKRAYPSIPNQPSEASAHFMFELAKNVLTKAGGNSSTSLFTQASTNQNHHGPHRALHMCAFQLGLYALGLHNCVSPNWLSRTYSSHVSWIIGQAMEIGAPAISFLIDTWEGHLTPPEVASMADRASRGWDNYMIYPAAELALSVLPHAAALNPNEITRAILQCKEQSDHMLERACITVENAAKGGGVYPEVLFQVARYWYELYLRNTPNSEHEQQHDEHHLIDHSPVSLSALLECQQQHHEMQLSQVGSAAPPSGMVGGPVPPLMPNLNAQVTAAPAQAPPAPGQVVVTTAPPSFQQGVATLPPLGLQPYHHQPYSFCQSIYHHHNLTYPATNQMQMYISAAAPPAQAYASYVPTAAGNNQVPQNGGPPPVSGVTPQMHQSYVHQSQAAGVSFQQLQQQQQLPPQAYQAISAVAPPQNLQQAAAAAAAAAAAFYAQAPPPSAAAAAAAVASQMRHQHAQAQAQAQNVYPFVQQQPPPSMPPVLPPPQQQPATGQQPQQLRQRHPHQYR